MAETLLGPHFLLSCRECRFPMRFDALAPPQTNRCVCPNCGFSRNPLDAAVRQPGDRVLVDRGAWTWTSPQRWELAAYTSPDDGALRVKRIVGLPGEIVAIRRGDVYIDGRLAAKPWTVFREMAVLVHDDAHRLPASSGLPPRWRPRQEDSLWQATPKGYECKPARRDAEFDWLDYHHWPCSGAPVPRDTPTPVRDQDGYNQGLARTLNDTADLLVSVRVRLDGPGVFALAIHDGREWLEARLDGGQAQILHEGEIIARGALAGSPRRERWRRVEFAVYDRQAALVIDGGDPLAVAYKPALEPFTPIASPVALGAGGRSVEVQELAVYRDAYYLGPSQTSVPWSREKPLEDDHYFLLGDNPPASIDSRHGSTLSLSRNAFAGRVQRRPRALKNSPAMRED